MVGMNHKVDPSKVLTIRMHRRDISHPRTLKIIAKLMHFLFIIQWVPCKHINGLDLLRPIDGWAYFHLRGPHERVGWVCFHLRGPHERAFRFDLLQLQRNLSLQNLRVDSTQSYFQSTFLTTALKSGLPAPRCLFHDTPAR